MKKKDSRFYTWLLRMSNLIGRMISIQIAMTCISLPLILMWGLPLSIISIIGNIIFAPFLTLFLLVSSCIFITELAHIPNDWLIAALEWITWAWGIPLNWATKSMLFELPAPSTIMLIAMLASLLLVLHYRFKRSITRSIVLVLATTGWCLVLMAITPSKAYFSCELGASTFEVVRAENKTIVIDTGCESRERSLTAFMNFTLGSQLRKTFGSSHINILVLLKPSRNACTVARILLQNSFNALILLPSIDRSLPTKTNMALIDLQNWAHREGHAVAYVTTTRDLTQTLRITPSDVIRRTKNFSHPALHITGAIGDASIFIKPSGTLKQDGKI